MDISFGQYSTILKNIHKIILKIEKIINLIMILEYGKIWIILIKKILKILLILL